MIVWIVVGYLVSLVLAWGVHHGDHRDQSYAWLSPHHWLVYIPMFLLPPAYLFALWVEDGFHSFNLKPITRAERWELYKAEFPILSEAETIDNFDRR